MDLCTINLLLPASTAFSKRNGPIMSLVQNSYQTLISYRCIYFLTITREFSERKYDNLSYLSINQFIKMKMNAKDEFV